MATFLYLFLASIAILSFVKGDTSYLYYTAPGGATYGELPGLYGAAANMKKNSKALGYPDTGVQCMKTEKEFLKGFHMRSISYDPRSRKVLMSVKNEKYPRSVTLGIINVCLAQEECYNATITPHLLFDNAQMDYMMSPFAYYGNTIYFLVTKEQDAPNGQLRRIVELRMLAGCREKYPVKIYTSFDITECSKKIATVVNVTYDIISPISLSNTLYVVNTGSDSFFLTQLQEVKLDEDNIPQTYTIELVLVRNSTGKVVSLHKEKVDPKFKQYEIADIGAIHLKNDKLCWSAVDTILCADWSNRGAVSNVVPVVPKGQSSKACLTMPGDEIAPLVVTGIAVAQTEKEFAIYFGCIAMTSGYGGAGLVKMSQGGKREIYNLKVNGTEIYAGSMFMVSNCVPEKTPPPQQTGGGYWVSGGICNLPSSFLALIMFLLVISL